ncbi:hypothetical protein GUI43_03272 [Micromonospora noduli]|nr:hypothetical protein GUI43_03272 [Micromonospora noduli]
MADPGLVRLPVVGEADRLPLDSDEHVRVQPLHLVRLLDHPVRVLLRGTPVVRVHLLPQRQATQRSPALPQLRGGDSGRQLRGGQVPTGVPLGGKVDRGTGVVPGLRGDRWLVQLGRGVLVPVDRLDAQHVVHERLAVDLLDHAEAGELPLDSVVVPVVVAVAGDQPGPGDPVHLFHPLDDLHRERQPGHPRLAGSPVGQLEGGGGGVPDGGLAAQVVHHPGEQVRLAVGGQVQVAHRTGGVAGQRRRPHQATGAGTQQVGHRHRRVGGDMRQVGQLGGGRPAVAGLVVPEPDLASAQVAQVHRAGAVHVGEEHPGRVELVQPGEPRRVVHLDLRAESSVADVGPVADGSVADPDQVGEPVAGHVGEEDALPVIRAQQPRPTVLVGGPECGSRRAVPRLGQRLVPGQHCVTGDQQVGPAVSGEVQQQQVGAGPVDGGQLAKRLEAGPAGVVGAADETRRYGAELDQLDPPVTVHVDQLLASAGQVGQRRHCGQRGDRADPAGAEVRPVVEGTLVPGQHPGEPFPVQVHPQLGPPVHAGRQVLQAAPLQFPGGRRDGGRCVFEGHRGQCGAGVPATGGRGVAALGHLDQGGQHRPGGVSQLHRADQAVRAHLRLVREVVEHQDPAAQPVGADLESRAVGGERVRPAGPVPGVSG